MKPNFSFAFLLASSLLARLTAADTASAGFDALCRYESGADMTPLANYEKLVAQSTKDAALRQRLEAEFGRVLTTESTFEAKRFACTQLAVIGGAGSVPALAGLLRNDDTVGIACFALAENSSSKAGDVLLAALDSVHGRSRVQVVDALGTRAEPRAVKVLTRLVVGPDKDAAGAALIALARIDTPPARKELLDASRRPDAALDPALNEALLLVAGRWAAAGDPAQARKLYEALLAVGHPKQVRRGAFEALARLDSDGGQQRVMTTLTGQDPDLKPSAIAMVAIFKGEGVSAKFAAQLGKLAPADQARLIQALALRGDAAARTAVEQQLGSKDKDVRFAAIVAVGRVGDAATVPLLVEATGMAEGMDELKAIEMALAGLKGGQAVDEALMARLANGVASRKMPLLAALVHRGNRTALPVFIVEADGEDVALAKLACQGLSRVAQPDDLPALLQALAGLRAGGARDQAEAAVGQVMNRASDPTGNSARVRAAMAEAKSSDVRCSMLRLLVACPDAAALAAAELASADPNAAVQQAARRALADWPDAAAWEPLVGIYRQAGSEAERVVALRGLARLLGEQNTRPDAQLMGRYRELLAGARSDDDRKLILGALAGCTDPAALALAVGQLENAGVRTEAQLAVRKIAESVKDQHPQEAQAALEKLKP